VAFQAKRPHVGKVAFAAAFGHRQYVVCVPKVTAEAPLFFEPTPRCPIELALVPPQRFRVEPAPGAYAAIASEDLLP